MTRRSLPVAALVLALILALVLALVPALAGAGPAGAESAPVAPFFDTRESGPADPTPPPPELTPLGRDLLAACGGWGGRPRRAAFESALNRHRAARDRLRAALEPGLTGGGGDFVRALGAAWFAAGGFRHIFCGEPGRDRLGGFHFRGRYRQAQERGWAGLMDPTACRRTEIRPPVYTVGVMFRAADGRFRPACVKGYLLDLDAEGLLREATRALIGARARPPRGEACRHVIGSGPDAVQAVFVVRHGAVRSFYGDASPNHRLSACG